MLRPFSSRWLWPLALATAPLLAPAAARSAAPGQPVLRVEAGEFDREQTVVSFQPPANAPRPLALVPRQGGKPVEVQQDENGVAWFVLPSLARHTAAEFHLAPATTPAPVRQPGINVRREGRKLQFERSSRTGPPQPLMAYQAEPGEFPRDNIKEAFRRGGYLHPIHAPNGRIVTDDFPPNHIHHHGVWWAWTKTEFQGRQPDFWNMGDNKGGVEFVAVDRTWNGPIHGGFQSRHRFVDRLAQPAVQALLETWTVTAYGAAADADGAWYFDLATEQHCATNAALQLPEYRYGGIGLRGNWAWNGRTNAGFLTSSGETQRDKGNASRGRWCAMHGLVDGARVGIAVLGHPGNFRAPEPMRLHPDEPFFNFAPQQAGPMSIEPGQTYRARYRFVVHNGPPSAPLIDRLWNDFANPPKTSLQAVATPPR